MKTILLLAALATIQAQKLCVPTKDQMAICHSGSELGKKANMAMYTCTKQLGLERSADLLDLNRAKKKPSKKPKCPKATKIMSNVEEEYAGEMCTFITMGWLDNDTMASNDDLIMEDIATLPDVIQAALNSDEYDKCVAKEEKAQLGYKKCMSSYSDEEQAILLEMTTGVAHIDCFKSLFQAGCAQHVSNIIDGLAGKPDAKWSSVVPDKLAMMPEQVAELTWPGRSVGPNDTVLTGEVYERPRVNWEAEEGALYTIMILDTGIEALGGLQYIHWFVTNVEGSSYSSLELGTEAMEYIPPFSVPLTEDGSIDQFGTPHPYLVLVFKQPGRIEVEETQVGCTSNLLLARINDKEALAEKYGLELIAGTFFQVPYSGMATKDMMCSLSRCTGTPFPFLVSGVNDLPMCNSSQEVFDVTIRGPVLDSIATYGQVLSPFNPDGFSNGIVATKADGISTGVFRETTALYGTFQSAPNPNGNLNETLEGQVNVALLSYQSEEGANALFSTLFEEAADLFPLLSGGSPTHIQLSKPDDQDFDLDAILRIPGEIVWLQLAKVTDDKFLELRDKLMTKMVNSPYIKRGYKFNVWREGTADFGIDNSQTELMMYTARSVEDQMAFLEDLMTNDPEFLTEFLGTYECIACTALTSQLGPEFYPPF